VVDGRRGVGRAWGGPFPAREVGARAGDCGGRVRDVRHRTLIRRAPVRFGGGGEGSSQLLQLPPMIANLGTGVLYLLCWAGRTGFSDAAEYAKLATFEYGNTFLLVAGLLNYLAMLDAFDIAAGRKP
jgi:hypothetical protein